MFLIISPKERRQPLLQGLIFHRKEGIQKFNKLTLSKSYVLPKMQLSKLKDSFAFLLKNKYLNISYDVKYCVVE